jgi:hypothetical protein
VPLRERCGSIAEAVRRLDEAGVGIDDIAVRTPTLDEDEPGQSTSFCVIARIAMRHITRP